ncbi:Zonadhesin, partial [Operophtera brumata]
MCTPGCECNPDYVVSENGKCVKLDDCPDYLRCNDRNATFKDCPNPCPGTCDFPGRVPCNKACLKTGCECKTDYYLNDEKKCVKLQDCPGAKACSVNETFMFCKVDCPSNYCAADDSRATVACSAPFPCGSGCSCKGDYYRSREDGRCILFSDCPPIKCTRPNEEYCARPPPCIFDKCTDIGQPNKCDWPYPNRPQCICKPGYYRNENDICVYGCRCKSGYILSDTNGICIKVEECPDVGCNGDPNAIVTVCPWPCPSTCESPNAGSYGYTCDPVGCQCKPGFILADNSGKCILPKACKCGNPCGANGTFSECAYRCPNQYCPRDDSQLKVACKPGRPCASGCLCKPYYLRKSYKDNSCVLASDCTPVKCTRPYEVWDPCASECLAENCNDLITVPECYPDPKNCQPQCVCCKGYYRNKSGICVHKKDCQCRSTCAVPNPPDCPFIQPSETNVDDCNCQAGYVLSEVGGKCIKIGECPRDQSCNGDPHARIKENPFPCPSTCESPNATPCKRKSDPIGCECEPGYLKSETGRCVLPDDCKGGNPCGENGTFVTCKYSCITNYCPIDDSRAIVVCEVYPIAACFSGCACRLNYKRRSREDPTCILSSECCPVNCTRPKEVWNPCPSDCGSEYCEAVDSPPAVCNTLVLNCNPRCVCEKNYFRNDDDVCVSTNECRKLNKWKKHHTKGL